MLCTQEGCMERESAGGGERERKRRRYGERLKHGNIDMLREAQRDRGRDRTFHRELERSRETESCVTCRDSDGEIWRQRERDTF